MTIGKRPALTVAPIVLAVLVAPVWATEWGLRAFPEGNLYPLHLADPHRPALGIVVEHVADESIADSGTSRFFLRAGGRYGLLELTSPAGRRYHLAVEAGFDAIFDRNRGYDAIGWDGNYGLIVAGRLGDGAFRIGVLHTSAHVGDEYAERTGRRRLDYTREELLASLAWPFGRGLTGYLEAGWGYDLRTEPLQEPGRLQAGLQFLSAPIWRDRWRWYWALDLQAMEERDWDLEAAAQLGLAVTSGARRWRLSVELLDGRVPLGEFYQVEETTLGLGLWLDPWARPQGFQR